MTNTKLREQSVDGPNLYSLFSTVIAKAGRQDMILSIGHDQWDRRKPIYDLFLRLRTVESLEQFLEHKSGRYHALARLECADQQARRRVIGNLIPTQH